MFLWGCRQYNGQSQKMIAAPRVLFIIMYHTLPFGHLMHLDTQKGPEIYKGHLKPSGQMQVVMHIRFAFIWMDIYE